jgi:hypothetical protein
MDDLLIRGAAVVDGTGGEPRSLDVAVRDGEGFRMPAIAGRASGHGAGVRKPPKHEPAGLRRWSMGISRFAWLWRRRNRLGVGTGESLVSEILRRARVESGSGRG